MAHQRNDAAPPVLGAWYNNFGDLWDDITGGVATVFGTGGAGGGYTPNGPIASPGGGASAFVPGWSVVLNADQIEWDDAQLVQLWKDAIDAEGGYPTRMPAGYPPMAGSVLTPAPAAGDLGARWEGPGTSLPNKPAPWSYTYAAENVIAADRRLRAGLPSPNGTPATPGAIDTIIPQTTPEDPSNPGGGGWNPFSMLNLSSYFKIAAIVVGAALLVPVLLPRQNPPRRRRARPRLR